MSIIIKPTEFKEMSWKNNKGSTLEIDILPKGSDFSKLNFGWRVSSASIEGSNVFSLFPGYDRVLTVLSGDGLILNGISLKTFDVFRFSGDEVVQCDLIKNKVEDLGVIFNRLLFQCEMSYIEVNEKIELELNKGIYFFKSLSDRLTVDGINLNPGEFLKLEGNKKNSVDTVAGRSTVILKIRLIGLN